MSTTKAPQQKKAPVIQINQEVLHNNLSGYVRKNLENILNELPDAEADRLCHAKRYERNAERASTRAGSYKRNLKRLRALQGGIGVISETMNYETMGVAALFTI